MNSEFKGPILALTLNMTISTTYRLAIMTIHLHILKLKAMAT